MDPQLMRFIREEIKKQINVVVTGQTVSADTETATLQNIFSGMDPVTDIPVAHPYGFCSKAIMGALTVTLRVGDHPGARMVALHRDNNRPTDLSTGESVMYSSTGHRFYAGLSGCFIGSKDAANPLVLGDVLKTYLNEIYTALQELYNAVILGTTALTSTPGNPTFPNPGVAANLSADLLTLTMKKLQYSDTALTNFLSAVNNTERGLPIQATPVIVPLIPS